MLTRVFSRALILGSHLRHEFNLNSLFLLPEVDLVIRIPLNMLANFELLHEFSLGIKNVPHQLWDWQSHPFFEKEFIQGYPTGYDPIHPFIGKAKHLAKNAIKRLIIFGGMRLSNPVLEAFGNAKTVRNNNSSRFGKFVELQFDNRGRISGAAIRTYLLERSRVCQVSDPERNYHCFYMLCAAPAEDVERYKLGNPRTFHYLNQSNCYELDGVDDSKEYLVTRKAMDIVGIGSDEQDSIFRVVAAILHLGNIEFTKWTESDSSEPKDEKSRFHLKTAAELFMCDEKSLEDSLCKRVIVTCDETITKCLDPDAATVSRDALAKIVYSRLFDWLVNKINNSIGQDPDSKYLIGVLDIYGFESFKTNSFEQFCINLTNEKLQQHFNQHVFKMEQEEYTKEEIDWSYIEFIDNQDVLDLLEKKPGGIIALLDEACMFPRSTHETFAQKVYQTFKDNKRFSKPKLARTDFTICHYAGDVTYQTELFLDKNKDYVVAEHQELLSASKCSFVSGLFPPLPEESSKSSKFSSIGSRFKVTLMSLVGIVIEGTQTVFILIYLVYFSSFIAQQSRMWSRFIILSLSFPGIFYLHLLIFHFCYFSIFMWFFTDFSVMAIRQKKFWTFCAQYLPCQHYFRLFGLITKKVLLKGGTYHKPSSPNTLKKLTVDFSVTVSDRPTISQEMLTHQKGLRYLFNNTFHVLQKASFLVVGPFSPSISTIYSFLEPSSLIMFQVTTLRMLTLDITSQSTLPRTQHQEFTRITSRCTRHLVSSCRVQSLVQESTFNIQLAIQSPYTHHYASKCDSSFPSLHDLSLRTCSFQVESDLISIPHMTFPGKRPVVSHNNFLIHATIQFKATHDNMSSSKVTWTQPLGSLGLFFTYQLTFLSMRLLSSQIPT
ncbi:hypothetical protein UlMin_003707 [Ulmus minor]